MLNLYNEPFKKCTSRNRNKLYYGSKKEFISDLCSVLQSYKKECIERKYRRPLLFNMQFNIQHSECWTFQIAIYKDKFKPLICEATIKGNGSTIKYCCRGSEIHDTFKNITEFREFLNREVMKEDEQAPTFLRRY